VRIADAWFRIGRDKCPTDAIDKQILVLRIPVHRRLAPAVCASSTTRLSAAGGPAPIRHRHTGVALVGLPRPCPAKVPRTATPRGRFDLCGRARGQRARLERFRDRIEELP
jgi:hypothetical protein